MVKYDTSRTVRFCMDSGTRYDYTVHNNIIKRLRSAGFTVIDGGIGPGTVGANYKHIPDTGHRIVFNLMNGVDTTNIREALSLYKTKGDSEWTYSYMHGKDVVVVLAWFGSSVDCVHPGGKGYEHLCTRNSGWGGCGGAMYNAKQKMDAGGKAGNKVYAICCSSDGGANPSQEDTTGNKIADEFLKFFEISDGTNTTTNTNTNTNANTTTTDDTGKTISSITTEKIYTKPYYQKIITANTNDIGAFTKALTFPTAGKYRVNMVFSGDTDYSPSQKTVNIEYYAGTIFKEELLQTITTKKYTDGTTSTVKEGDTKNNNHTRSVITTTTYKSGKEDKKSTTEIQNDKKDNTFQKDNTTTDNNTTKDNTTTDNNTTVISKTARSPFLNYIPCIKDTTTGEYLPNVAEMMVKNTPFKWVDYTKTYTLTKKQYMEVLDRDSKIMQLHDFSNSKYTAFTTEDEPNTYHVIKRERWNAVEECLYYRQTSLQRQRDKHRKKVSTDMPDKIKIDFANLTLTAYQGGEWKDPWTFKAKECNYWFCSDRQDTGYTCGPTSDSIATQVLHHWLSEWYMKKATNAHGGTAPDTNVNALNHNGFTAKTYSPWSHRTEYFERLRKGQPVVIHQTESDGHYMCSVDISDDESQILVLNSTGDSGDGYYNKIKSGWNTISNTKTNSPGVGWWVAPNWTISESEKNQLNNFFKSMGGAWRRTQNLKENIRKYI